MGSIALLFVTQQIYFNPFLFNNIWAFGYLYVFICTGNHLNQPLGHNSVLNGVIEMQGLYLSPAPCSYFDISHLDCMYKNRGVTFWRNKMSVIKFSNGAHTQYFKTSQQAKNRTKQEGNSDTVLVADIR